MEQFFLWLNVMAVVILASSLSSSLQIYIKTRAAWKKYYLLTKLGFLLWLILYTYDYFSLIYISASNTIPINRIFASIILLLSGFLLFVYPLFLIMIAGKKVKIRTKIFSALFSLLFLIVGFIFIILKKPIIENYLHIFFYIILFVCSLYGIFRKEKITHNTLKSEGFIFIICTLVYTPLIIGEYSLFHFSSIENSYFPDGAFTLPAYCITWGLWVIIKNSILMYEARSEEEKTIPEDFIEKHNITDREKEIISYLITGLNNVDIASKLFISLRTVDTHVYNIYRKCNVKNRIGLLNEIDSHRVSL